MAINFKNTSGIYAMPLLKNVGLKAAANEGWKLKDCPVCGEKCFEMPQAEALKMLGYKGMCTACMLKESL